MYKTSHLFEIGLFDENFRLHEDRELKHRFEKTYQIYRLELPLYRYRRHENNITNRDLIIGQNSIDHLNTCNYILSKYPEFFNEAMSCYSKNIRSLRHRLPYLSALIFSLKVSFDLRSFFA